MVVEYGEDCRILCHCESILMVSSFRSLGVALIGHPVVGTMVGEKVVVFGIEMVG